jgi:hypothetical protein
MPVQTTEDPKQPQLSNSNSGIRAAGTEGIDTLTYPDLWRPGSYAGVQDVYVQVRYFPDDTSVITVNGKSQGAPPKTYAQVKLTGQGGGASQAEVLSAVKNALKDSLTQGIGYQVTVS